MGVIGYIDPAAYAAADLAGVNRTQYSPLIRFIQVPSIHLLDADIVGHAFESGAGGVMLFTYRDSAVREADESLECVFRTGGGKGCERCEEAERVTNIMIFLFDRSMRPSPRNKFRKPQ
jgi:coenzyme F420-reducing hydrogenase delta subunit